MAFRRTADVRSCGYIELFVLSKDDVMSSIRDYPEAQRILAKHGRKRLALGSKVASGPRDETTSGSNSDSEIELKITRPDSDGSSQSLFEENGVIENSNSATQKVTHTTVSKTIAFSRIHQLKSVHRVNSWFLQETVCFLIHHTKSRFQWFI